MIDIISYRELTDAVREYVKDADVFTVARIVKPLRDKIHDEALNVSWEMWDEKTPLGKISADLVKDSLEPEQVVFIVKEGEKPVQSFSKSPYTGENLTYDNVEQTAEQLITAYQQEYMKRRLVNIVIDKLLEDEV